MKTIVILAIFFTIIFANLISYSAALEKCERPSTAFSTASSDSEDNIFHTTLNDQEAELSIIQMSIRTELASLEPLEKECEKRQHNLALYLKVSQKIIDCEKSIKYNLQTLNNIHEQLTNMLPILNPASWLHRRTSQLLAKAVTMKTTYEHLYQKYMQPKSPKAPPPLKKGDSSSPKMNHRSIRKYHTK